MSVSAMAKVWASDLERDEKYITLCLADFGNDEGESIYPAIPYISWKTGYSVTQVKAILRKLRSSGVLSVDFEGSKYGTNLYKINLDKLPERPAYVPAATGRPAAKEPEKEGSKTAPILPEPEKEGSENALSGGENRPLGGAKTAPNPLVNTLVKPLGESSAPKPDLLDGMLYFAKKAQTKGVDVGDYPEDVREVIALYCKLYNQRPPIKTKGGKGDYSAWISEARYLLQAGGSLTLDAMQSVKEKPYKWMLDVMIARPGALIKAVRARAGELQAHSEAAAENGWTDAELAETRARLQALKAAQSPAQA